MFKVFTQRIKSVIEKGFWADDDGLSLADVVVMLVLPVWMYVAVKFALAEHLSQVQVDFFTVVSYPLLIAVGGKAIGYLPLPWSGRVRRRAVDVDDEYSASIEQSSRTRQTDPTLS